MTLTNNNLLKIVEVFTPNPGKMKGGWFSELLIVAADKVNNYWLLQSCCSPQAKFIAVVRHVYCEMMFDKWLTSFMCTGWWNTVVPATLFIYS